MVLKRVEADPYYRQILYYCLDQIAPSVPGMRPRHAFVCIPRPDRSRHTTWTTYNFLLQLRGRKAITIYDRARRSELEIERFYRGEHRNLVFDERKAAPGKPFELQPGEGVHVPVNAPHFVKNGLKCRCRSALRFGRQRAIGAALCTGSTSDCAGSDSRRGRWARARCSIERRTWAIRCTLAPSERSNVDDQCDCQANACGMSSP